MGEKRVWFPLPRGQLHCGHRAAASSDLPSTGVFPLRGTPGKVGEMDRRIQITIQHQPAGNARVLAADGPARERRLLVHPPAA